MFKHRVVIGLLSVATVAGVLGGCSKDSSYPTNTSYTPSPTPSPQPNTVAIGNFAFAPATLTVAVNASVTFTNNDGVTHTAVGDNGAWDTGSIPPGGSRAVKFASAGTYPYHCSVHPDMKGTITVQ